MEVRLFLTKRSGLVWFSFPDVVWALVPAVGASLVNAVLTLEPVKASTPTHKQSTSITTDEPSLQAYVFIICPITEIVVTV